MGCDLSTVSDFSSIAIMIPPQGDEPYVFKAWTFLPQDSLLGHPNELLYRKFIEEGSMIITPGNVVDYDFIANKIKEINDICPIEGIYLDKWNASQFQIH